MEGKRAKKAAMKMSTQALRCAFGVRSNALLAMVAACFLLLPVKPMAIALPCFAPLNEQVGGKTFIYEPHFGLKFRPVLKLQHPAIVQPLTKMLIITMYTFPTSQRVI